MGARAVKVSEIEMTAIREAAALQSRSISGQAEHWLRLGRAFERDPRFGYAKVEEALKGLVAPMDLTEDEQELYFDRMDSLLSGSSPESDAFFKNMRENVGGVGMDEQGNIVEFKPAKASS